MTLKYEHRANDITMTADQCDRWIKALRSGKYKQGKGRLCSPLNGELSYCCLGVYAEIKGMLKEFHLGYGVNHAGQILLSGNNLPKPEIGLHADIVDDLWRMNDGFRPHSFDKIADYIETEIRPFCKETNTND